MNFFSSEFHDLGDLFVEQLKDVYDAEKRLIQALPQMEEAATSNELKVAFREHLEQTKSHCDKVEQVFRMLGKEPEETTCAGMKGLVAEGKEIISAKGDSAVRDAGLICAAQKVEHYEIGTYGTLRSFAEQLGRSDIAAVLQEILDDEEDTDKKLTLIAESSVNVMARH